MEHKLIVERNILAKLWITEHRNNSCLVNNGISW